MTIGKQIAAALAAALKSIEPDLKDGNRELTIPEGIEKLSGLPSDFVPHLTADVCIKNGILDCVRIAQAMFDLVFVSLVIGYAQGKKVGRQQAEEDAGLSATGGVA